MSATEQGAKEAQFKANVIKLNKSLQTLEQTTNALAESAKVAMENKDFSEGTLMPASQALEQQQLQLCDLQKLLASEVTEARRAGFAGRSTLADFVRMEQKTKIVFQLAVLMIGKMRPRLLKITQDREIGLKEVKDMAILEQVLPRIQAAVTAVELASTTVAKQAAPIVANPPEEGDEKELLVASIETAAAEALLGLDVCRQDLHLTVQSVRAFAPEARGNAQVALIALQSQLTQHNKILLVYKTFKVQLPKLVEHGKQIAEVSDKLAGNEYAIEKAEAISKTAVLTRQKCEAIDMHLEPVLAGIVEASKLLSTKFKNSVDRRGVASVDAVSLDKAAKLRMRCEELTQKIIVVNTKAKDQRDEFKAEAAVEKATAGIAKAEKKWKFCQASEMPFLMGCEVLAGDENEKVLQECDDAFVATNEACKEMRACVTAQLVACRGFKQELADSTTALLNPFLEKNQEIETKLAKFKKDNQDRRVTSELTETLDMAETFEKQLKAATKLSEVLASSGLEDEDEKTLSETIEKNTAAIKEAHESIKEARKLVAAKSQHLTNVNRSHPSVLAINLILSTGQAKLQQLSHIVTKAQNLSKMQAALALAETKLAEAAAQTEKAEEMVPAEGETFSVEVIAAIGEACAEATKLIKVAASVKPLIAMAKDYPNSKATLEKVVERVTAAQSRVDEIKTSTKDRRETALGQNFLEVAETHTKATEDCLITMEKAEAPFLTGKSDGTKDVPDALVKSAEAAKACRAALDTASNYTKQKLLEVGKFSEGIGNHVKDGFAAMADRRKSVTATLAVFTKETDRRVKDLKMAEALMQTEELEASAEKTLAATEPFTSEEAAKMTEAEAEAPLKAFTEANAEYALLSHALNVILQARFKDQKGDAEQMVVVKELQTRCKSAKDQITEKRKSVAPHEKRALGKKLLAEAQVEVASLEAELKKATEACAPLLQAGGLEFLISTSIQTLAAALQAHMQEENVTKEDVFKGIGKGKPVQEKAFVKYLANLPEEIKRDELSAFSEERRLAIFKHLASDDKAITMADFDGLFHQTYSCVQSVAVTDKFSVDEGETLFKVAAHTTVELFGLIKTDEAGMARSECKVADKTGWITVKQGVKNHLTICTRFKTYCESMDKTLVACLAAGNKIANSVRGKVKQRGTVDDADKEVWDKIGELVTTTGNVQKEINALKFQATKGKTDFASKQNSEKNAHLEARNAKEAASYLDGPKGLVAELDAHVKDVEEAASPIVSLAAEDLGHFPTPATLSELVEKFATAAQEKSTEAQASIKEQNVVLAAVKPPLTGGIQEAKKQLKLLDTRIIEGKKKVNAVGQLVARKVKQLVKGSMEPSAEAFRKLAQKEGKSVDEFFDSLKMEGLPPSEEKIEESVFCKMHESIQEPPVSSELALLVCRNLEAGGISRETFKKFCVVHYKCVKSLAFTDDMDISKCETLRKVFEGEVVEIIEGPVQDATNGMDRVRAKAVKDGVIGWLTISGSKGTCFLEKM